jgi:multidrug efflux pump subunit AcrA (membrane-fusion protein)
MRVSPVLLLLVPLGLGIGITALLISRAEPPARVEGAERTAAVTTIVAEARPLAPEVRGYGNVRAPERWAAVAEVAGTITWRLPALEPGNILPAGTEVLRIDPSAYELALAQAEADLAALEAEITQLDVEEENTRRILAIEENRLALARRDLERVQELVAQGAAPPTRADEQERATLQIERGAAELANALGLIPSRRARLEAQVARTEAARARAERDLDRTRIATPFELRVGEVHVEALQFAAAGQPLVTADGVARAEVTAQIPLEAFPRLVGAARSDQPVGMAALEAAGERITAIVSLIADPSQSWQGRLVRVEGALEPQARSVPVVVAVDDPYAGADPPARLPLVPNMYVEVTLTGPGGPPRVSVPDHAVHGGDTLYLRDPDGRLELRAVTLAFRQRGLAVIESGLEPGEAVVTSDLVPAIPGMRLVEVPE